MQRAAQDSGCDALVPELQSIAVLEGTWQYRNPGRLIAAEPGFTQARSVLADVGNLQLPPLFGLCPTIRAC